MRIALLAIAFVLSLFAARLFQLQGVDANAYAAMAEAEGTRHVTLHAARGRILDRNGSELASSIDAVAITADPTMTADDATRIAAVLADTLQLDYFTTVEKLRTPDTQFVYLARRIPTWRAAAMFTALNDAGLAGVFSERDPLRTYPEARAVSNLVGIVGEDPDADEDTEDGGTGLELQFDDLLRGTDGEATYVNSPGGAQIPMADSSVVPAVDGQDIVTTLDRELQYFASQRLAQQVRTTGSDWGAAITIDVQTGQVFQFAQYPTFNPDSADLDVESTTNPGIDFVFEPGSVQKVLTFAAVADQGKVTPRTRFTVPGALHVDGYEINDVTEHGTIRLTATGAIAKSSNIATILASRRISRDQLGSYLSGFGLGQETGIPLPGESAGILAPADTWSDAQAATVAFGQSLSVTALQMTAAVGAIANGGEYIAPTLVSGFGQPDGSVEEAPAPLTRRVVSERAARIVATMMTAVTQEGGSAPDAGIPDYLVAGKTGTSQRASGTGGYEAGARTVSFVGFAPADEPRFVTYVVLDNPSENIFGGTGAGPVFRDIMAMALQKYGVEPTGSKPVDIPLEW
uniref:Cell division protein FtsI [Peptidoglycan synthetase] n=1 Tax=uncultured Nocardioidaceae bacterium TaxID=253824 RepID=A0A6J4L0X6_9ACTN|nr:MAG: Cell division protein FtsI [Peptidoglycan synthetase] [uncultured Nocardioidaceae bacterium]